jgi:leucyl-tRNA synthetase
MKSYDHQSIEPKWQAAWESAHIFEPTEDVHAEKAYILDMFPYPSGSGLHVGHILGYTGTDVLSRKARMEGKNVLHPMGWDSFGLPAENYAIKTGVHPVISTKANIQEFKRQFKQAGIGYAWSRELSSSDPSYYRWTQHLFQLLYSKGLAYRKEGMVNWCPSCQTVLANEQVVSGRCERCSTEVVQRMLNQWYFKITDYAERLLTDLDKLDWPEKIKAMQRNWIGKSEGAHLYFEVENSNEKIKVFTTRPDTLYGVTYVVLSPEHPLVASLTTTEKQEEVVAYQAYASKKSELERQVVSKEKTGVFTGGYAIHPLTGEKLPIWVADYVLASYGTGAVMAVPAHDARDFAFAKAFALPMKQVIEGELSAEGVMSDSGLLINSAAFSGRKSTEVGAEMTQQAGGEMVTTYRLRDWLVSRQRFWGAPIPVAYDAMGKEYLIPDSELPVELPMNVDFAPTGKSPLADAEEWKAYKHPSTSEKLTREVDTLDTFVCSSWYFLRYPDPTYQQGLFNPEAVTRWLPVDTYIGGAEHAVLHLLYSRFITKFLFDEGLIHFDEPFMHLKNQGMILGPDHQKMSKSKGNVINPDDVIATYGADTLRMYELFMAPFELEKPWDTKGIIGTRRFLDKLWRLQEMVTDNPPTDQENHVIHGAIKKVGNDISGCSFNTAVSTLMETVNSLASQSKVSREGYHSLLKITSPLAPHITEELWELTGGSGCIALQAWPAYAEGYTVASLLTYVVQVNGKVRGKMEVPASIEDQGQIEAQAKALPSVVPHLTGKQITKTIVVPGKLISFVVAE